MNEEKKTYLGLGFLALLGLLLTGLLVYKATRLKSSFLTPPSPTATSTASPASSQASPSAILADLVLNFGESSPAGQRLATYSAFPSQKGTALDLLLQVSEKFQFSVDYEQQSFGAFIKSIAGLANTRREFWLFYVNGLLAPVAADKQPLKNGDVIEFRYSSSP